MTSDNPEFDAPPLPEAGGEFEDSRATPHNLEAEQGVLGGLLLSPERWDLIEGRITQEDFFSPAYGAIFAAIESVTGRNEPIDLLVLKDELLRAGKYEAVGGNSALASLLDAVPSGAHVEYYAQIVKEKATIRRLIATSTEIIARATGGQDKADDMLEFAESSIFDVSTRGSSGEAAPIRHVLQQTWERLEEAVAGGGKHGVTGRATGFFELDEMTAGLHDDELIIVAGRPAMGKSTFALNLLRHMAVDYNQPVVIYTLEMSSENLVRNLLSAQGRMDAQLLRKLTLSEENLSNLTMAADSLLNAPIFIDDTPAISLSELRGKTRRLKARHDIQAVFIDYLQLMMGSAQARNRSREQEVSEISRGLKALAKELHVPVIALAQLSRKSEGRQENRPILSDLRESGAIEQDADMVLLIHRPEYYNAEDSPGEAELIIAKQRNGPTGTVNLNFQGNLLRFNNLSARPEPGIIADSDSM